MVPPAAVGGAGSGNIPGRNTAGPAFVVFAEGMLPDGDRAHAIAL
jgi:hypothetical protein